jgi:hypothetical protein
MSRSATSLIILALLGATASGVTLKNTHQHHQTASNKACECMSWQDVYRNHNVTCGQGLELAVFGGMKAKEFVGMEFCVHFYHNISSNFCTQGMFGTPNEEQWCYVSSECQELGGGSPVNSEVSWKQCQDDVDTTLRTLTPEQLYNLSVKEDRDAGLMLKMAYPTWPTTAELGGLHWEDVKDYLNGTATEAAQNVTNALQFLETYKRPYVFDSEDGHPPIGVVYGKKIYESNLTPWMMNHLKRQRTSSQAADAVKSPLVSIVGHIANDPFRHAGKINVYTCIRGCEN